VSQHGAEFEISGSDRNALVPRVTCNDVGALTPARRKYSGILKDGKLVDDCMGYRFRRTSDDGGERANVQQDWDTIVAQKGGANVRLRDISGTRTELLAV